MITIIIFKVIYIIFKYKKIYDIIFLFIKLELIILSLIFLFKKINVLIYIFLSSIVILSNILFSTQFQVYMLLINKIISII